MIVAATGILLFLLGSVGAWHALRASDYDDRWNDRSPARFARFGYREDRLPMTRGRRIGGVASGLALMALGIVLLATS
ncbi:hypothetical protein OM076_01095 [Solirubrobacter ginsenosidimutans]|uniref:Uncharacterized protein n=1 Tax=Solirubrobacter ginsenosidimutans TaxID=490573 RepID=A0A9X3MMA5_9ACTN|nr:hypothetical protein [Solirubrobacter ginsenosidimutans]MDA0158844.1 hypothetical protein [Solirubrobacter ginsenosidimutans]